jgi:diacylglycerol kinase (ATP)
MDRSNKIKKAKDLGSAAIFLALVAYSAVVIIDISKLFLN